MGELVGEVPVTVETAGIVHVDASQKGSGCTDGRSLAGGRENGPCGDCEERGCVAMLKVAAQRAWGREVVVPDRPWGCPALGRYAMTS